MVIATAALAAVLAVASATPPDRDWRATQHDYRYTLAGLVGLADPLRPGVAAAVADCRAAGLRVVMITGDYPETARSIARAIGASGSEDVITGPERSYG